MVPSSACTGVPPEDLSRDVGEATVTPVVACIKESSTLASKAVSVSVSGDSYKAELASSGSVTAAKEPSDFAAASGCTVLSGSEKKFKKGTGGAAQSSKTTRAEEFSEA